MSKKTSGLDMVANLIRRTVKFTGRLFERIWDQILFVKEKGAIGYGKLNTYYRNRYGEDLHISWKIVLVLIVFITAPITLPVFLIIAAVRAI